MIESAFISVIIPVYNKAKYITETLNSVLKQNFTDFEVIIVDDGSTDNSIDIIKSFNDSRLKIIQKKNGGVSSARNEGVKYAVGEWILFLDADDTLTANALSVFNELILRYLNYKVFVSDLWWKKKKQCASRTCGKKEKIIRNTMKSLWFREYYSRPGNTLIHKTVLQAIGGYNEQLTYNEDYEFSLRLLSQYVIIYTPEKLMYYHQDLEDGESMKIHPIENDFSTYIPFLSFDSIYKKLLLYHVVYYSVYRRSRDADYYKSIQDSVFNSSFRLVYYTFSLLKKIILICRLK